MNDTTESDHTIGHQFHDVINKSCLTSKFGVGLMHSQTYIKEEIFEHCENILFKVEWWGQGQKHKQACLRESEKRMKAVSRKFFFRSFALKNVKTFYNIRRKLQC